MITWKWEYLWREYPDPLESGELNRLGQDGWELVNFAVLPESDYCCPQFYYIFKRARPIEEATEE